MATNQTPHSLPSCYPAVPPVFEIEANKSGTFTFSDADHLYQLLEEASLARIGSTVIFDLVSLAQEELAEQVSRKNQEKSMQVQRIEQDQASVSDEKKFMIRMYYVLFPWFQTTGHADGSGSEFSADEDEPIPGVVTMEHYRPQHFLGSVHNLVQSLPSTLRLIRVSEEES